MTNLNMIFHVVVSVYRLVKIRNSPQFPDEFRNGLLFDRLRQIMQISKPVKFSRRPGTGRQQYSKRISSFELRFDLKFAIIHPTNGLLKLLLKSNLQ